MDQIVKVCELTGLVDWSQDFWEYAATMAEEWFREQGNRVHTEYYLWYREGGENLPLNQVNWPMIAENKPGPDWMLAANERISPAMTQEQVKMWLHKTMNRLPILGTRE